MKTKLIPLLLIFALLLAGCQSSSTPASPPPAQASISLTDGLGRTVTLTQPAQRIISLSPPITEILYALDASTRVVGRDSFSDYPEGAINLPDVGGSFGKYSEETILSLQPDLILAGEINTPELVTSLENLGLTVFYLKNPTDLDSLYSLLMVAGQLCGQETSATQLVDSLKARAAALQVKLANIDTRPTVFYELDASDPAKPFTPGPATFYTTLIQLAGGENIGAKLDADWAQISLERLLVEDPYFILLGDSIWGVTPQSVAERAGWQSLTAVKEGRVLVFDDNLLVRFGPRWLDGLEALARILHPEVFE